MLVKICGIKKLDDALKSIEYGADAIGVLVGQKHVSNDFLTKEEAKYIISNINSNISTVLVTHITDYEEIIFLASYIGVNTIQLHSDISINDIKKIRNEIPNIKLIKCIHVIDNNSINEALKYECYVDYILLDTYNKNTNQVGGTGLTHDWNISKKIIEEIKKPVILAGGLNINNIKMAKELKPYGVDVNNGVKNKDGYKDYNILKKFIKICKK